MNTTLPGPWVVGQDGALVSLAVDQHAVQELAAQGAGEAFAGGVHAWSLDRGAQDPGASGLEDGAGRGCGIRSVVAEQESHGEVVGLLHRPLAGRMFGDAAGVHPAAAVLDEHQHMQSS